VASLGEKTEAVNGIGEVKETSTMVKTDWREKFHS
jgi:hypothetical protein